MKIIKIGSCWECADKDICGAYDRCDNTRDLLRNKTILPDCTLTDADDWFKEELEKRFPDDNCINTYLENIGYPPYNMETINWLKYEILKPKT